MEGGSDFPTDPAQEKSNGAAVSMIVVTPDGIPDGCSEGLLDGIPDG